MISLTVIVKGVVTVAVPSETEMVREYELQLSKSISLAVEMMPVTEIAKSELLAPESEYARLSLSSSSAADASTTCVPTSMFSSIAALKVGRFDR